MHFERGQRSIQAVFELSLHRLVYRHPTTLTHTLNNPLQKASKLLQQLVYLSRHNTLRIISYINLYPCILHNTCQTQRCATKVMRLFDQRHTRYVPSRPAGLGGLHYQVWGIEGAYWCRSIEESGDSVNAEVLVLRGSSLAGLSCSQECL